MSTPYENPNAEQPGSQPPAGGDGSSAGNAPQPPAPGYQQPRSHQQGYEQPSNPQPGYQAPGNPQPGYQQPGNREAGYQQPGYRSPSYQAPNYQSPQSPPAYQQPAPGYRDELPRGAKSAAANFSNFPDRLKTVSGIPKEIKNAYLLFLIGAALNLIGSLINLIQAASQRSAIYVGGAAVSFIIAIIFTAVVLWLSLLMKERVNWARIVMIVLAALGAISALVSLAAAFLVGLSIIGLLSSVAFVAGGIMLLRPGGRAYYASRNAPSYLR